MKYNQSMASILAEMNKVKKEQEGETQDPIDQAKKKIDKIKKIAVLKKQMADIQKSENTDIEEATYEFFFSAGTGKDNKAKISGRNLNDAEAKLKIKHKGIEINYVKKNGKEMSVKDIMNEKLDKEDEPSVKKVVKMLKKASDAHAGQAKDLEKDLKDETDLGEFKKMIVTVNNPAKRKELLGDVQRFGKLSGLRIDKMRDGKSFKIDGKGQDLNKFAIDMKNYYGAEIKAESVEEALEVKWDSNKQGWFDKQGRRRYLGKMATNKLMSKAIDKAKETGDFINPFKLKHGQKPEQVEEKTELNEAININIVKGMTQRNDHFGARLYIAEQMRDKEMMTIYQGLGLAHDNYNRYVGNSAVMVRQKLESALKVKIIGQYGRQKGAEIIKAL